MLASTTVTVGNREEFEVAETDPKRAANVLPDRGIEVAIVRQDPKVLMKSRDGGIRRASRN